MALRLSGITMRHNVTPPEVIIRRRCRLNFPPPVNLMPPLCQRNRLPPDYRLQNGRESWHCIPRAGWRSVTFTYFFSYGVFSPFWSVCQAVWANAGNGLLLGVGLVARFLGEVCSLRLA